MGFAILAGIGLGLLQQKWSPLINNGVYFLYWGVLAPTRSCEGPFSVSDLKLLPFRHKNGVCWFQLQ